MIHQGDLQGPCVRVGGQACLPGEEQGVQGLTPHVELELTGRGVAGADGPARFVARQPSQLDLGQPPRAVDAVHDLQHLRLTCDGAQQPVTPRSRFAPETGREQRLQRVSRVAQPAVPVIPVTDAAEFLRQRRGRGRHDPAGRGVGQGLQGDDRPVDGLVVRPVPVSGMRTPLGPEIRRRGQGLLGVRIRHLRLVAGRPRHDERNPVALTHGEVRERGPVLAAQRDGGGQPDEVRPGNGMDFAAQVPDPRNLPAVVEPQPQRRSHRHLAVQAHRDAHDVRRIRPGRHEVDDPHRAVRGDPVRLEHEGVACVPAGGARAARRGGKRPVSLLVIAQQCGERGGRVETGQAEPVD